MQECDAGPDYECGSGEREGELAEVFYVEGLGNLGVVARKADFFAGFAAGYFEGSFVEGVRFAAGEGGLACVLLADTTDYTRHLSGIWIAWNRIGPYQSNSSTCWRAWLGRRADRHACLRKAGLGQQRVC